MATTFNDSRLEVKYAGQTKYCQTCSRCQKSPDTHSVAPIPSTPATDKAAKGFLAALYKHAGRGMDLRLEADRTEFMVGALIAKVDSRVVKLVAHSGNQALLESKFTKCGDFNVVKEFPAALGIGDCYDISGNKFTPSAPRTQCAAPKLLCALFDPAGPYAGKIKEVELSEIFYRDFRHTGKKNTKWSTNDTVPSCNGCASFLPELLCDLPRD